MLFNSLDFLFVFFPLSYAAFLWAGRSGSNRAPVAVLLVASLIFYAYWQLQDVPLLIVSMAVNYGIGRTLGRLIDVGEHNKARVALVAGVAFNIGLIAYYKYFNFFLAGVVEALGLPPTKLVIELPLGISFFTFTQIAFLVDVWRRKTKEDGPLHYGLFVTFYPHLIAGPILHQSEMGPQFRSPTFGRPTLAYVSCGLAIFVIGLAKKVLLADPIAGYANPVFAAAEAGKMLTIWEAWAGTLAYTLQIYFDFSGYSDMAVGLGLMLGVRLPINFNSPYKADSIIDFWRRWHMTLSAFLRDYLYIPLGGSRGGVHRHYSNIMVTMLLGGLWHGASWTFVLWGGLHGLAIAINHAWRGMSAPSLAVPAWLAQSASRGLTFLVVALLWVLFRAESFTGAMRMYRAMSGLDGVALPALLARLIGREGESMFGNGLLAQGNFWPLIMAGLVTDETIAGLLALLLLTAVAMLLRNSQELVGYRYRTDEVGATQQTVPSGETLVWRWPVLAGGCLALCFWLSVLSVSRPSQFLYFNF